jgi:hypothetical protein
MDFWMSGLMDGLRGFARFSAWPCPARTSSDASYPLRDVRMLLGFA